ncbi:MAG TPA: isoleucine--tRNA ligase [Candidatus Nanoarchaeia archaeon]|nr:isoleucine--tRNA ligase [Candidatus Nanoarchaeia archaeon]
MYDFKQAESEILKFWDGKKTFEKLVKKNNGGKKFSFIDGPITANNPMGIHHAWGRTYKDLFQRFKAMQGFEQRFQNGFDCQGLWIEREEEKELGLKNKKDIEKFGILNFVNSCKKRVEKFSKIQTRQSIRLGQWMDWENSYYTNTSNNNLHNWFLLKIYFDKGWLYKGHDVVPWCGRCGTASSKHDIATEGYREVSHDSIYIEYPVKGRKNEYLLVWTTTPWTLPGNVAIAVDSKKDYAVATGSVEGNKYYLLKSVAEKIGLKIEKIIKGKNLVGLKYESPFDELPRVRQTLGNYEHRIIESDEEILAISEEEGTGLVHIAPGQGSEDFRLGKKLNLPVIELIDEGANYLDGMGEFSDKNAKKNPALIFNYLEKLEKGKYFFDKVSYRHRYPHCWRCGEELVFRLVDEWYVKCNEIRKKLIEENKKVRWYPEYGKVRQEEWFKNMSDWLISRKRYYGLPLPVWECECGEVFVAGSLKELRERAVDKKKVDNLKEIHRPWIDEIKVKCRKCGGEVFRIPDVGDAWLDAGIVPFSTLDYLTDRKHWEKWFPADLISESMPGQSRGWFNALMWASVAITGKVPFKSLFGYETLKDEKGEEMHKSKGNSIPFDEAAEKIGADPMRLLYCIQDPSQEMRFGFHVAKDPANNLNIFYNLGNLIENSKEININKIEDKWIMSRLNSLVKNMTEELENLRPHLAVRGLRDFWLNDFSRRYVQFVRDRLSAEDKEAQFVVREVYLTLLKLLAPACPFITEHVWQNLRKKGIVKEESVHLCDWPKTDKKKIDNLLEKRMENTLKIIEMGLAERDKNKTGLRWPLPRVLIYVKGMNNYEILEDVIKTQLNVKEIKFESPALKGTELSVELDTKITPELEAEGYARELSRQVQAFRKKLGLQKKDKIELAIFAGGDLKKILETQKDFLKNRTNSKKLEILENVTTPKERFKNNIDFNIKDKRGKIAIKY